MVGCWPALDLRQMNYVQMKRIESILFLLAFSWLAMAQGTDIRLSVKGIEGQSVIIGYYFNKQILVKDTVTLDHAGAASYRPKEKLPQGSYVLYFPDQSYLDFLVGDDQQFSISTLQGGRVDMTIISGSLESEEFLAYQKFIARMQTEYGELQKQMEGHHDDEALVASVRQRSEAITGQVKQYMARLEEKHPNTYLSLFFRGLREVETPDFKNQQPALHDSLLQQKRYYHFRNHYFDHLVLTDERLLRTPYFTAKLERYFTEVVPQIPDTVASEAIALIERTKSEPSVFKYVVSYLYNMVNESKIMGMDAALVAIAEKYYLSGLASWADAKFVDELKTQVAKIKYTLIGKVAPDLKMVSFDQQYFRLHEVQSPFTILVFWETECGHCKKEIPQLHTVWREKLSRDIKVFCVYTQNNEAEWKHFIEEHHFDDWINVYDPRNLTNFRYLYNINSTPQIFILDKEKKIVAKKIGVAQVEEVMRYLMNEKK